VPPLAGVGDRAGDDITALGGQTFGVHVLPRWFCRRKSDLSVLHSTLRRRVSGG
jgi:hypothetical protein